MQEGTRRTLNYVLVGVACFLVGWFAGREYFKYQIRSAFQTAAAVLGGLSGSGQTTAADNKPQAPPPEEKKEPQLLSVSLIKKGFSPHDIENQVFQDRITFTLLFKNIGDKDIRAFDGILTFSDLLDNKILSSRLAITDPIKAGSTMTWPGQMEYNQFESSNQRLRGEGQQNLKVSFVLRKVLFTDGTSKEFN